MAHALGGIPCLIREILYAPSCPQEVAVLFEVALTHHNQGSYEASINSYMQGLRKWEDILLDERQPELRAELELSDTKREERAARAVADAMEVLRAQEREAASNSRYYSSEGPERGEGEFDEEKKKMELFEEEKQRQREEKDAKCKDYIQAVHQAPDAAKSQWTEGRIFVHMAVGSVLESAANDELALSEYLAALRLCQTLPVHYTLLLTATAYSFLGGLYYHISQYDFAADYFFRALEIRENNLFSNHVDVGSLLNNIGVVLHVLDRPSDALALMYRAESIFASQLNASHLRLEVTRSNIRKTKAVFLKGASLPQVPYTPLPAPVIPGKERAVKFFTAKKKKKVADKDKKKKK